MIADVADDRLALGGERRDQVAEPAAQVRDDHVGGRAAASGR